MTLCKHQGEGENWMGDTKEWLEERVRSFSPDNDSPQSLGDLGAVEQLARAYMGLSGKESSVFGVSSPSTWASIDVEPIKKTIITALEKWLAILEVDEAVEVTLRLQNADIELEVPPQVERALETRNAAIATPAALFASPGDIEELRIRISSLPELVSTERWKNLITRWQALSKLVDSHDAFEVYQPLEIKPAMSVADIANIQANLDRPIPNELLYVAAHFSGGVRFGWVYNLSAIAGSPEFPMNRLVEGQGGSPEESGGLFDVGSLPEFLGCRDWERDNEITEWSTVIPLFQYESDYVAIDTKDGDKQPVVYMSHEEDCLHHPLGSSFFEFLEKWTSVNLIDIESYVFSTLFNKEGFDAEADGLQEWSTWLEKAVQQIK
jgi:hypothetical protein